MTQQLVQASLTGGELSPTLWGHTDLARYGISVALCRNWIVNLGGGLKNRSGTVLVATCATQGLRSRLIPFQFSATQSYVLEFGDRLMRVIRGGSVLNAQVVVSSAAFVETDAGGGTTFHVPGSYLRPQVTAVYLDSTWQGHALQYQTPRTNYCPSSQNLFSWSPGTGVTITGVSSEPDPAGAGGMASSLAYAGGGAANAFRLLSQVFGLTPGTYTASVWLKAAAPMDLILTCGGATVTCAVTTAWQRFQVSFVLTSNALCRLGLYQTSGDNSAFTVYGFGPQVEDGPSATSYINTGSGVGTGPATVTDYALIQDAEGTRAVFNYAPYAGITQTPVWDGVYDSGSPLEVETPYTAADLPLLRFAQQNDVLTISHPNHPPHQVRRLGEADWQVVEQAFDLGPFEDVNADKTKTVRFSGTDGLVEVVASAPIFVPDQVGALLYAQQVINVEPWATGKTVTAGDVRRSDGKNYRALTSGTTGTDQPLQTDGKWNDGGITWLFLDEGFGVARITSVSTDGLTAQATTTSHVPENLTVSATAAQPVVKVFPSLIFVGNAEFEVTGHGYAVGDSASWSLTYKDTAGNDQTSEGTAVVDQVPDADHFIVAVLFSTLFPNAAFVPGTGLDLVSGTTSSTSESSWRWAFGAWSDAKGWPACVCYHQQRLVFAGSATHPTTMWMSRTDAFGDFGQSNPILDDDALTFSLAAGQQSPIQSMLPLGQLMAFTEGSSWLIGNSAQAALTPGNLFARQQGFNGASTTPVLGADGALLFVQAKGETVRGIGYSYAYAYDNYSSANNLSIHASHLLDGHQIEEWTLHQVPYSCVWAVRDDGLLLGFTYNQEQQIAAWHRHDTANGAFESVCCISEGDEDALYVIVRRQVGDDTVRMVERMATRVVRDLADGVFLDSSLSFDGRNDSTQTITLSGGSSWDQTDVITLVSSSALFGTRALVGDQIGFVLPDGAFLRVTILTVASGTSATGLPNRQVPAEYRSAARSDWFRAVPKISGLDHLVGQTVGVLGDGAALGTLVVAEDGSVTLTSPHFRICVGLPITADVETLGVAFPLPDSGLSRVKAINAVRLMVSESCALQAGRDEANLMQVKSRNFQFYGATDGPFSGIEGVSIPTSWTTDGSILIRNGAPLPVTLTAIIPEVAVGGSAG